MNEKQMRRRFTTPFKLRAIHQFGIDKSKSKTARRFGIATKTLRGWLAQKENLLAQVRCHLRYRLPSTREGKHPELERELNEEIVRLRTGGVCVSGQTVINQARLIALRMMTPFSGSKMWLYRFLARMLRSILIVLLLTLHI